MGAAAAAATATPAVNAELARLVTRLRPIAAPFLRLFSRAPSSLY